MVLHAVRGGAREGDGDGKSGRGRAGGGEKDGETKPSGWVI